VAQFDSVQLMKLMNTYKPAHLEFSHGKGLWLYDMQGKAYLDGIAGIAVNSLGHAHPEFTYRVQSQLQNLVHVSNLYRIPQQEEAAEKLCRLAAMDRVFFCNSGAEANEAALKLSRLYAGKKGLKKPKTIVFEGAFHGRTLATLSASAGEKVKKGFFSLEGDFIRVALNDVQAVEAAAKDASAIFIEPVQGEGGVLPCAPGFLKSLREIADQQDLLFMADEVQTGNGRTGTYFAYEQDSILPDVLTTAKGLGNGLPIGACLVRGKAAELFTPGSHGSTFGGNPLVCAAANAVMDIVEHENLHERAGDLGLFLKQGLEDLKSPLVQEIRVRGLMIGVELTEEIPGLTELGHNKGILFNVTQKKVLRLLPPLIISYKEAQEMIDRIGKVLYDAVNLISEKTYQGGKV
jgi:acetylornithine/N-succinyldiaminopimelate aminotransferase